MSGLEAASALVSIGTTALGATGTILGANDAARGAYANQRYVMQNAPATLNRGIFAKQQFDQQANEARAVATREAATAARQRDYVVGAGRAAAAAGGGNATDASVVGSLASVEQQGDYEKLMALYSGENKARGLEYAGQNALTDAQNEITSDRFNVDSAVSRARQGQRSALLSGIGSVAGAAGDAASGVIKRRSLEDAAAFNDFNARMERARNNPTILGGAKSASDMYRSAYDHFERYIRRPYTTFGF
jgi:hypothetical protein